MLNKKAEKFLGEFVRLSTIVSLQLKGVNLMHKKVWSKIRPD